MRIRFLRDQVYETEGVGKGPSFPSGFVVDETEVAAVLGREFSVEWARSWLNRWVQRDVAEEVDKRTPTAAEAKAAEEKPVDKPAEVERPPLSLGKRLTKGHDG